MPTATDFFGYTITNLGPLTTTYTPPASCATETSNLAFVDPNSLKYNSGWVHCGQLTQGDCVPSGSEIDDLVKSFTSVAKQGLFVYHSPGLVCPSGWTKAGSFGRKTDSEITFSGVFSTGTPTSFQTWESHQWLAATAIFEGFLDAGETLEMCCPSGYQSFEEGYCLSSLGKADELGYSTMCYNLIEEPSYVEVTSFDGSTYNPPLASRVSETIVGSTEHVTLTSELGDIAMATYVPGILLVHKEGDEEDDDDSGANALFPRQSALRAIAITFGVAIGARLLAAW